MRAFGQDEQASGALTSADELFRSAASTLQAKSLAIVGASERARWPSEIFKNLREFGYPGRIVLVNPRQSQVFGQPCFASLRDVGAPIEHALVIVPALAVPDVLLDAEAAGLKSATVYASMIGDGEDPESLKRGAWLKEFTAGSRLRVAGPNCMGAYSYRERLLGYPNAELCRLAPGSVACIFQSGGLIQFWMKAAAERGLRFSYGITSGNEPDLGLADYLNFVIDDPETLQVVLFIEGIRKPAAFMHAAGRALAMGKPILAIKSGATAQSQAASQSHTGAIAGDYAAYLAMCERYGIVNCRSLDDLVETALAFDGGRLPKGPRIGFVTTSGATVDLLYDYAEAERRGHAGFQRHDESRAASADASRITREIRSTWEFLQPSKLPLIPVRPPPPIPTSIWWPGLRPCRARPTPGATLPAAGAARQDGEAGRGLWPRDLASGRAASLVSASGRVSVSAGDPPHHPRAQCVVVSCGAPRPCAESAAAPDPERAFAGDAGRNSRAVRHRHAEEPNCCKRRGGRSGGRAHRLPGRIEDSCRRDLAQDRSRRGRA